MGEVDWASVASSPTGKIGDTLVSQARAGTANAIFARRLRSFVAGRATMMELTGWAYNIDTKERPSFLVGDQFGIVRPRLTGVRRADVAAAMNLANDDVGFQLQFFTSAGLTAVDKTATDFALVACHGEDGEIAEISWVVDLACASLPYSDVKIPSHFTTHPDQKPDYVEGFIDTADAVDGNIVKFDFDFPIDERINIRFGSADGRVEPSEMIAIKESDRGTTHAIVKLGPPALDDRSLVRWLQDWADGSSFVYLWFKDLEVTQVGVFAVTE
jgi:hypothetical protein